jgi:hypothetical protein
MQESGDSGDIEYDDVAGCIDIIAIRGGASGEGSFSAGVNGSCAAVVGRGFYNMVLIDLIDVRIARRCSIGGRGARGRG